MLTAVLKAATGNPQVKVPAPSSETGSYPKHSRRHGQPAPTAAGPAYPAPPGQPSRPQTAPPSGSDPRQTTTRSPAPNSQGRATTAPIELRRRGTGRALCRPAKTHVVSEGNHRKQSLHG